MAKQPSRLKVRISLNYYLDIERFLVTRGVIAPEGGDIKTLLKSQKEREIHQFVTESSHLAGPAFQLDLGLMQEISERVTEMDTINVIKLDPNTYKYQQGLR